MTQVPTDRPRPVPDETSAAYWEAAAQGHLSLPQCTHCRHFCFPPAPVCPTCGATRPDYAYLPVAGSGVVRSWTVVRDPFLPGFATEVPYVLVDVELDCQTDLRVIGRLLDGPGARLGSGQRVVTAFEAIAEEVSVPAFCLVRP